MLDNIFTSRDVFYRILLVSCSSHFFLLMPTFSPFGCRFGLFFYVLSSPDRHRYWKFIFTEGDSLQESYIGYTWLQWSSIASKYKQNTQKTIVFKHDNGTLIPVNLVNTSNTMMCTSVRHYRRRIKVCRVQYRKLVLPKREKPAWSGPLLCILTARSIGLH